MSGKSAFDGKKLYIDRRNSSCHIIPLNMRLVITQATAVNLRLENLATYPENKVWGKGIDDGRYHSRPLFVVDMGYEGQVDLSYAEPCTCP